MILRAYDRDPMNAKPAIKAAESRAFAIRHTMAEVCAEAGVLPQVWSRAKARNRISVQTLRKIEGALDRLEAAKQAA